jgi:hypothetical protein
MLERERKSSEALCLMDQLSDKFHIPFNQDSYKAYKDRGYIGQVRPLLTMRKIYSVDELFPFFEHLGRHVYYCATQPETPDWTLIEEVLVNDFLEPRSKLLTDEVAVNKEPGGPLGQSSLVVRLDIE